MFNYLSKLVDATNTYYSFALIVYGFILYGLRHDHIFIWVLLGALLLLALWVGDAVSRLQRLREVLYGFRIVAESMTYDIGKSNRYILHYTTELQAEDNHLFAYPISHQWTGSGEGQLPKIVGEGNGLLGVVGQDGMAQPYKLNLSSGGDWRYWFIAFNPPLQKGDRTTIKYSQEFYDEDKKAKPSLYYFVRTSMESLELCVNFKNGTLPKQVTACYFKPSDNKRPYKSKDFTYDEDKRSIVWKIEKPKRGYCYRIDWA